MMSNNNTYVDVIRLDNDASLRIPIKCNKWLKLDSSDNLSTCLCYLDKLYSQKIWKPYELNQDNKKSQNFVITDEKNALLAIINSLYGYSLDCKNEDVLMQQRNIYLHLLPLKSFSYDENEFILEYNIDNLFNLRNVLLYSPCAIEMNNEKILFIFYQLLKFIQLLHNLNINCANIKLNDVYLDKNYWIKIKLPLKSVLELYKYDDSIMKQSESEIIYSNLKVNVNTSHLLKLSLVDLYNSYKHLKYADLVNITNDWCANKISNFDYLLMLNCLAGRRLNCPYNHPIYPWITDFKSRNMNLRDLSCSKIRLQKGDANLDLTYQASGMESVYGGYHLTEFLSEITYFVYKSRVTDKTTLCQHVRSIWVPNEYPPTMVRLYAWTPEECIPEFFYDTSILTSMHDDMPDLQVPAWCDSKEEFIRIHRALLESDVVSRHLHNWIDLVFGYKLTGEAAIQAKNVCLPLIDSHESMRSFGVVQLFKIPHPNRMLKPDYSINFEKRDNRKSPYNEVIIPYRQRFSFNSYESENKKKGKVEPTEQISLPENYNPLEALSDIETMLKFTHNNYHSLPNHENTIKKKNLEFEELEADDLKRCTCLLAEILLFQKLKCMPEENTYEERLMYIRNTIVKEPASLPNTFRWFIANILQPFGELSQTKKPKGNYLENILSRETALINVDTLLSQHLTVLPFKPFFESLYKFSELFNRIDTLISEFYDIKSINAKQLETNTSFVKVNTPDSIHKQIDINEDFADYERFLINFDIDDEADYLIKLEILQEQKFYIASNYIPHIMLDMSNSKYNCITQVICNKNDAFELILPYVQNLFENPHTCVNSVLYLFNKVAKFLSKRELNKKFLPIIMNLLSVVEFENMTTDYQMDREQQKKKFCKLFDYSFINQLRILFGLKVFLNQIAPLVVEAISGFKDFNFEDIVTDTKPEKSVATQSGTTSLVNEKQEQGKPIPKVETQTNEIFQMESEGFNYNPNNLDDDLQDDIQNDELQEDVSSHNPFGIPIKKAQRSNDYNSFNSDKVNKSSEILFNLDGVPSVQSNLSNPSLNEVEVQPIKDDNNENNCKKREINFAISTEASKTFRKMIVSLGPVLTCKYLCTDLLKMLAICYMNIKCLCVVENSENPLNSSKTIEGDKFALRLLESLKSVAVLYGEQVIVLQYFAHVTNTVLASHQRLTSRLEASLLAAIVLIHYFVAYLDLKILMDYSQYIFSQILLPTIEIFSNANAKFPNGSLSRHVLCFKVLDILLLMSLRLGRENTRIEMTHVLKKFFNSFSMIRAYLNMPSTTRPVTINNPKLTLTKLNMIKQQSSSGSLKRSSISDNNDESQLKITGAIVDSFEEYYKISYNPESVGSNYKVHRRNPSDSANKHRAQSFSLSNFNNEDQDNININSQVPNDAGEPQKPIAQIKDSCNEELLNTFTAELAHTAYFSLSRYISGSYVDSILSNGDLIHLLCVEYEKTKSKELNSEMKGKTTSRKIYKTKPSPVGLIKLTPSRPIISSSSYGSSFNENISVVGSQIQINEEANDYSMFVNNTFSVKFNEHELRDMKSSIDGSRHLSDNWLAYWEQEIRNTQKTNNFELKQISLMTFSGHSSAVRCITALNNESSIISGSRDKTVKLWTLKNHGDGGKKSVLSSQWTYNQHKKAVFSVYFVDSLRYGVSCDGVIHVWDPFVGKKLYQFEWQTVQCTGSLPSPSTFIIAATSDNYVKYIDLRSKGFAYEFRLSNASSGSIKSLTANENTLLAAFSGGIMSLLDVRTGWLQEAFKIHDNEINQIKFYNSDRFVCTYNDGSIALCSSKDSSFSKLQLRSMLKVYNDPVSSFSIHGSQLISGTSSNKIGIHTNIDKPNEICFTSNKLQPESFKGALSSLTYLPLNRLLVLGSDNGEMRLFC